MRRDPHQRPAEPRLLAGIPQDRGFHQPLHPCTHRSVSGLSLGHPIFLTETCTSPGKAGSGTAEWRPEWIENPREPLISRVKDRPGEFILLRRRVRIELEAG